MPKPLMPKKLKLKGPVMTYKTFSGTITKNVVLLIIGDWNAKVGNQETSGITGEFGLAVENEAGQRLTEFCQENTLIRANTLF